MDEFSSLSRGYGRNFFPPLAYGLSLTLKIINVPRFQDNHPWKSIRPSNLLSLMDYFQLWIFVTFTMGLSTKKKMTCLSRFFIYQITRKYIVQCSKHLAFQILHSQLLLSPKWFVTTCRLNDSLFECLHR